MDIEEQPKDWTARFRRSDAPFRVPALAEAEELMRAGLLKAEAYAVLAPWAGRVIGPIDNEALSDVLRVEVCNIVSQPGGRITAKLTPDGIERIRAALAGRLS